jgi:hypothetical protein
MPNRELESVLQLSADGSRVELFRHWNEHRAWRFTYGNRSRGLDGSDLNHGRTAPDPVTHRDFLTLGDAIHTLSPDGEWVSWSVLEVHPDYKQQVWQLREQILKSADEGRRRAARKQDSQWAEACGQRISGIRPGKTEQLSQTAIPPETTHDLILGASIAIIEHLRKVPMSAEEIREFEATMSRVLERRKTERLEHS